MRFNFKGIKFRTWSYFLIFSVVILGLLGFLLIAFIKPYYRENRIDTINVIVEKIENELLLGKGDEAGVEETEKLILEQAAQSGPDAGKTV